jgi:crossover junction endodeoxyribonuclease RuvC
LTSTRDSSKRAEVRRVLGIDPGSRATGWGVVTVSGRRVQSAEFGCLRPPRNATRAVTLAWLADRLDELIAAKEPDVVAVEITFAAALPRAALALAEARGALLATLGRRGVPVYEYEPARVKMAVVGHGSAEKRQVAFMVQRHLGLDRAPSADAADALALALCHLWSAP